MNIQQPESLRSRLKPWLRLLRLQNWGRVYLYQLFFTVLLLLPAGGLSGHNLTILGTYLLASMAGYIHNAICDRASDSGSENPISGGQIKLSSAVILMLALLAISFSLLVGMGGDIQLIGGVLGYYLLWFMYNEKLFGFRLKESLLGPAAASMILVVGFPLLILLTSDSVPWIMWTALALYGLSGEIGHTIKDIEGDQISGIKTYAVRVGKAAAERHANVILALSSVTFLFATWQAFGPSAMLASCGLGLALAIANRLHRLWKMRFWPPPEKMVHVK